MPKRACLANFWEGGRGRSKNWGISGYPNDFKFSGIICR